MKKLNGRIFRKYNHFVLYDLNDVIVCYFNSYDELKRYINIPAYNLVCRFNASEDYCINVFIERKKYRLFTFS